MMFMTISLLRGHVHFGAKLTSTSLLFTRFHPFLSLLFQSFSSQTHTSYFEVHYMIITPRFLPTCIILPLTVPRPSIPIAHSHLLTSRLGSCSSTSARHRDSPLHTIPSSVLRAIIIHTNTHVIITTHVSVSSVHSHRLAFYTPTSYISIYPPCRYYPKTCSISLHASSNHTYPLSYLPRNTT